MKVDAIWNYKHYHSLSGHNELRSKMMKVTVSYCCCVLSVCLTLAAGEVIAEPHGIKLPEFNITCDPQNSESQGNCQNETLETIAIKSKDLTDVQINIKILQLKLNANVSFTNLTSLTINGEPGLTTITCTASGNVSAGIVLRNIMDTITLNNLKLISCGSLISDTLDGKTYSSSLTITHSWNVELNGLVIARSRGLGLTILNHQGGRVNIKSAIFIENNPPQEYVTSEPALRGGGVYIKLTGQLFAPTQNITPMTFHFDDCTFENNRDHTKHYEADVLRVVYDGHGRGGGVNLLLKSGLKNVNVSFTGCRFIANHAFHGGGLAVEILGDTNRETENIRVEIVDSMFKQNGRNNTIGFGGGVNLIFHTDSDEHNIANSHYIMKNVDFVENFAEQGGGVYIYSRRQTVPNSNSMRFENCTFKHNKAHMGSAVMVSPSVFFRTIKWGQGQSIVPMFLDCQFFENEVNNRQFHEVHRAHGVGTIYVSMYEIGFMGCNDFENNDGSGIYTVNGIVNFQNSSVSFINNTGFQGGAVALIGSSTMIVGPNNYDFIGNKAIYYGCLLYTSPSPRDATLSRMPSSA